MSEDQPETVPDAVDERLSRVEAAIDAIRKVVTGAHKDATATTQARLDAPGSVADEVQSELDRREAAKKQQEKDELLHGVVEDVKAMKEQPPVTPPRRVEKLMGWH